MKDLDFDELDKAVSSLMADVPGAVTPALVKSDDTPQPAAVTDDAAAGNDNTIKPGGTVPEVAKPISVPSAAEEKIADTPQEKSVTPAAPSLATKRSGRFMDVVHPSSDMRKPAMASRSAVTVTPLNPEVVPDQPEQEAPVAETKETTADTPVVSNTPWPDPIDVHEQQAAALDLEQPLVEDAPDSTVSDATSIPAEEPLSEKPVDSDEPSSPFLPDAKVEKRPLGGNSNDEPATDATHETPDEKMPDPLPAEFNSDVLAIESTGTAAASPAEATANVAEESHDVEESVSLQGGTTEPAPVASGPVSIAPQYKPEESSRDQSHAPLYDSAANPHALTHPTKKRSGMWVVLAIVLLIAAGAGVGAFVYFQHML